MFTKIPFTCSLKIYIAHETPINLTSVTSMTNVTTPVDEMLDYLKTIQKADKEVGMFMNSQSRFNKFLSTIFYF
jgi:hypothetical protein